MMDSRENFELLFHKYLENRCSPEELDEVVNLLVNSTFRAQAHQLMEEKLRAQDEVMPDNQDLKDRLQARLEAILSESGNKNRINFKRYTLVWRWVAAASVILMLGIGGLIFFQNYRQPTYPQFVENQPVEDILPGGNKAILTLSNGATIMLDSAHKGVLSQQGSSRVSNTPSGLLSYHAAASASEVVYNTLTTPNGGQYRLQLPDGTLVWLNNASSIHYPTAFNGTERVVEITGEAYFEVMHDEQKPFKVKVGNQLIEDIGTHFNVNAYADENVIKTTLLEGSVRVQYKANRSTSVVLQPSQQAVVKENGKINVRTLEDADDVIAWKSGMFYFDNANIKTVMRQLAKWYNIKVQYQGNPPERIFKGKIQRNIPLSVVLKNIGGEGIHYTIKDKTVTIYP